MEGGALGTMEEPGGEYLSVWVSADTEQTKTSSSFSIRSYVFMATCHAMSECRTQMDKAKFLFGECSSLTHPQSQ